MTSLDLFIESVVFGRDCCLHRPKKKKEEICETCERYMRRSFCVSWCAMPFLFEALSKRVGKVSLAMDPDGCGVRANKKKLIFSRFAPLSLALASLIWNGFEEEVKDILKEDADPVMRAYYNPHFPRK